MDDAINIPLRDQPWIKENMLHLHKLYLVSLAQIFVCFASLVCGLSFFVCFGFLLQFTIIGMDVELGLTIGLLLVFSMLCVYLFYKFIRHLNFLGISCQKHQQLQWWNLWTLVANSLMGLGGVFIAVWLFLLVNDLQQDAKKHLAKNEPCFIKKELPPHSSFITPVA